MAFIRPVSLTRGGAVTPQVYAWVEANTDRLKIIGFNGFIGTEAEFHRVRVTFEGGKRQHGGTRKAAGAKRRGWGRVYLTEVSISWGGEAARRASASGPLPPLRKSAMSQ